LLPKDRRLGAVALALLASVGQVRPLVAPAPRLAHATTGDEIVPPETAPGPGQIRNSNQILIRSLLQSVIPSSRIHQEHWGDDPAVAAARLAAEPFASADMVLISGGASVGEHDYTARVLENAGYELAVRKINSRPGRPLLVGFRGRQIAFGLPGNPVSHFVCFHLLVNQAVARLRGVPLPEWKPLPLAAALPDCFIGKRQRAAYPCDSSAGVEQLRAPCCAAQHSGAILRAVGNKGIARGYVG
jgi:molybdopterin molybdotransferase